MEQFFLPPSIAAIVGNDPFETDSTGKSSAQVRLYPHHVLKILPPNSETENEAAMLRWLDGRLPVPALCACEQRDGLLYMLRTRIEGEMLCADRYLDDPPLLYTLCAKALKELWSVDIAASPNSVSRLSERLKQARRNVELGLVDMDQCEPETFGRDGFKSPSELLNWLETHCPPEDLVMTHGDCCLPNLLAQGKNFSGFIDLGKAGPADRWQDVALLLRSLHHNFAGVYGGRKRGGYDPQALLSLLDLPMDSEKLRFYLLLDELF